MRAAGLNGAPPADALTGVAILVDGRRWYARASARPRGQDVPPVLLVHGFGISSSYFVPTAERLARQSEVYAPDLPGHGRSDAPRKPLDVAGLADALARWMSAMAIRRARVVANSMGCQTAVELALRHAEVVDRLVLIGPTLDRKARTLPCAAARLLAGGAHERPSMLGLIVKDYVRMTPRLLQEFRAMRTHRIEERLPQVARPVLFVRGEHDRIAPQRWVEELARLTPGSRIVVIPAAGHAPHYSEPEDLIRAIRGFLEAGENGGASRG